MPSSLTALQRGQGLVAPGPELSKSGARSLCVGGAPDCLSGSRAAEVRGEEGAPGGTGGDGGGYAPIPTGGVGGATRGPNLCPHSWQKTSLPGLSHPQVPQITRPEWDIAGGRPSSWPLHGRFWTPGRRRLELQSETQSVGVPDFELEVEAHKLRQTCFAHRRG